MKSALIIDDNEGIIASVSVVLPSFTKCSASSLSEAIKLMKNHKFDVVFLDLQLPDSNAKRTIEMLPMLRRLAGDAAVILMTGHADAIGNAKYAVDALLLKPFDGLDIREAVCSAEAAQTRCERDDGSLVRMAKAILAFV